MATKLFSASLLISTIVGCLSGLIVYVIKIEDTENVQVLNRTADGDGDSVKYSPGIVLIMYLLYFLLLCYNLVLSAILFNTNDNNIWSSSGGLSIIASNLVGFVVVISTMEGLQIPLKPENQKYVSLLHSYAV